MKRQIKPRKVVWNPRIGPAANARRQLPRLASEFFGQVRSALAANPTPDQLHQVRLAAKRIRYTLELFRPCYGPALEVRLDSLRELQQVLGEINDCAATGRLLAKSAGASPNRARAERFLAARLREKTTDLRRRWAGGMGAPGQEVVWTQYLAIHARLPRTMPGSPD